jgi:CBS domain-containing protein
MRCREIMQQPVHSVLEGDTVFVAARIMREEDVGFLPVSDTHGIVVGILTDRDIATRVCAAGSNASDTAVRTVMTTGVIACQPDDTVSKAAALMRRHRVTRIVVLNRGRRPLGILSLSDIAQYDRPSNVGRTLQSVAERKYSPARV